LEELPVDALFIVPAKTIDTLSTGAAAGGQ